jgi:indole-3-glycerol phosphate synthase
MFLDRIVADKRAEVAQRRARVPLAELEAMVRDRPAPLDLAVALAGAGLSLIAEVKKASPSKGVLRADLDPVAVARTYARCGAAAISVLTDEPYFRGSLVDLEVVKAYLPAVPVLRKDFILEPYQVYEARASGADALLLIVAILDDTVFGELLDLSHELGMRCLVEVHNVTELERALTSRTRIIGINNRNLDTMEVDLETTGRLRPQVPAGRLVVSESGIRGRADVERLRSWGVDAVLVGEALVTADDIAARIKELFDEG